MDRGSQRVWFYRGLYVLAALALIFARLLPLGGSQFLASPDILFVLTLAWVSRRPDHVPIPLIAAVTLFTDFLFMRPPGLWSAIMIVACEFMRSRAGRAAGLPFLVEWMFAAAAVAGAAALERLVMLAAGLPVPGIGDFTGFVAATSLAYPIAVAIIWAVFGVRRTAAETSYGGDFR